jgi:hypothetical protein
LLKLSARPAFPDCDGSPHQRFGFAVSPLPIHDLPELRQRVGEVLVGPALLGKVDRLPDLHLTLRIISRAQELAPLICRVP